MSDTIQQIPLEQIHPHPDNRRVGGFDKAKLEQLAESIGPQIAAAYETGKMPKLLEALG